MNTPRNQYYGANHIKFNVVNKSSKPRYHAVAWSTKNGHILSRYNTDKSLEEAIENIPQVVARAKERIEDHSVIDVTVFVSEGTRYITEQIHVKSDALE